GRCRSTQRRNSSLRSAPAQLPWKRPPKFDARNESADETTSIEYRRDPRPRGCATVYLSEMKVPVPRCSYLETARVPTSPESSGCPALVVSGSAKFPAIVRLDKIENRPERDDAGRINLGVRHVVMAFDVIEVDRFGNA